MKKLFVGLFVVCLSVATVKETLAQGMYSNGDWVKLTSETKTDSKTGKPLRVDYFAKRSSVKIIGDNQYSLDLLSNLTPEFTGDKSWLMKLELNCDDFSSRTVYMSGHSEHFARGKENFGGGDQTAKWSPPPRDDAGWMAMVNKLCGP